MRKYMIIKQLLSKCNINSKNFKFINVLSTLELFDIFIASLKYLFSYQNNQQISIQIKKSLKTIKYHNQKHKLFSILE